MHSLRARFGWTTALLLVIQAGSIAVAVVSGRMVLAAGAQEQSLAEAREQVQRLGEAARELYVHEAHTYIEGGPGHLSHHAEAAAEVDTALRAVRSAALPEDAVAGVDRLQEHLRAANRHFGLVVTPMARAGILDRDRAVVLHQETERLAAAVSTEVAGLLAVVDAAQARERAAAEAATSRAWQATAVLFFGAAGLVFALSRSLARAVLAPLDQLAAAARAFGEGRAAPLPPPQAAEIDALSDAFREMTGRVRAAEEQRVRVERLAELGEMSAAVAHELMNPLTVILGHPELRRRELADLRAEAEHARRVVSGLLGFARPAEEAPVWLELGELASECVDRFLPTADARDVGLVLTVRSGVRMQASPAAVRQVLDNLVRNALDAAPGGSTVELVVRDGPVVEVRDRGAGIAASVRVRLYQPFATGRPDGTGLGLAVSQRIARALGGRLVHRDREGGGTVATWHVRETDA